MEETDRLKINEMLNRATKNTAKLERDKNTLLNHIGAKTVPNAKRMLDRERAEFARTKEQLGEVVQSLDVDNWRNAVLRAKSLLNKLEREALPTWLKTISPYWIGKVNPNRYKFWMNCCREQFLVALAELQNDVELGLEVNVEEEIEEMRKYYLESQPGDFIEAIARYVTSDENNEEDES